MDDRGRFAQSLENLRPVLAAGWRALVNRRNSAKLSKTRSKTHHKAVRRAARRARDMGHTVTRFDRLIRRLRPLTEIPFPRGSGIAASLLLVFGFATYGVVRGEHLPVVIAQLKDTRDAAANALGFRISSIALGGQKHMSREEILAIAGVTGRTSLLFFDADEARINLKANPWISDATILKLYPDRLHISVTEREPFALWQKDGQVSVISADGTVVQSYAGARFARLPLVVGQGAERQASEFLNVLNRYPDIRDQTRAAVLVAERRWNLRLKSGIDIRLPEHDMAPAIEQLIALDRDKALLSRDITAVDLRLPDRVTVRQSDAAAKAREESIKALKVKRKGSDA